MSNRIYEFVRSQVVGLIALFIALSGAAYAATELEKNSVGSKQIKNGEVQSKDVKNDSLTGADVNESTLQGIQGPQGPQGERGPAGPASSTAADLNCTGCVDTVNIADFAVTMPKLGDGATLSELADDDGSGSGLDADLLDGQSSAAFAPASHVHDDRYFTEAELSVSDGSTANTGANRVHWDILNGVPAGFADGTDDTGGTATDLNCASPCVSASELADGASLGEISDDDGSASGLDADFLDGQSSSAFATASHTHDDRYWKLSGNAGTNPASDFFGTTDSQSLNLRVNNFRALRLEPASNGGIPAPNLIGGSPDNMVTAGVYAATIAGGGRSSAVNPATANRVTDQFGTVGGGANNQAGNAGAVGDRQLDTVAGGGFNTASGGSSTVGGGDQNTASGDHATVAGGDRITASGSDATVGGGAQNTASNPVSTIGGGVNNAATGNVSTIGGGGGNAASGETSTIAGGTVNTASGVSSTVPGGQSNVAAGDYSFVSGLRAKNTDATHDGVFLFADSQNADFNSSAANEFAARASGGFRFVSGASTSCTIPAGTASITCTSDRNAKTDFAAIRPDEVLRQLSRMPIESWVYKEDPQAVRHLGPTAQAFQRAFGLGEDPRAISALDADGVALAAIKGLNERVDQLSGKAGPSTSAAPRADATLPLVAVLGIAVLGALLAAALGAALGLRWHGEARGRLATG